VTEEWRCLDGISLRQDATGTWASGVPIATETVLPDVIDLRDPTHFLLHGRIADMVNVAGKRTSLVHLNYHLNAIDGVTDGAFVMADTAGDDSVSRLAAFVVAPGRTAGFLLAELRKRIDVAFLPRPLCLVPALPRNALGKLPHAEVQRLIAETCRPIGPPADVHPPPSDQLTPPSPPDPQPSSDRHPQSSADRHPRARPGDQPPPPDAESPPHAGAATHRFPLDHPTAAGHFPGNPIIPGAVLLREILAAIAPQAGACEIRSAKFHRPVRPGDTLVTTWTAAENGDIRFTASVESSSRPAVSGALRPPTP
jgi:hypothetical protein